MVKTPLRPPSNQYLNIIYGYDVLRSLCWCISVIDSNSKNVISDYFAQTKKDIYYDLALNRLREKSYIIQLITYDSRRGLMKDLFNAPIQMRQFHMVVIVM